MPGLMTSGTIFGGLTVGAMLFAAWERVKILLSKAWSLMFVSARLGQNDGNNLSSAVRRLLMREFKCSKLGVKTYVAMHEFVRPLKKSQMVAFETIPFQPTIWWRRWNPIVVSDQGEMIELTFLRWTYNLDKLITEAVDKLNQSMDMEMDGTLPHGLGAYHRFFVRRLYGSIGSEGSGKGRNRGNEPTEAKGMPDSPQMVSGPRSGNADKDTSRPLKWSRDDLGQPIRRDAVEILSLKNHMIDAISEATRWRKSERWFKDRSIPWKRGWLLYGIPGSGKTAFVRAVGQKMDMPVFSFDLSTMTNKDLSENWSSTMGHAPCIALIEDIDAVFDGRKNVAVTGMEQGLTFDCLLNTIDGVENTDGVFVIVTTNNVEKLDPALGNPINHSGMSTRPGRIDRAIYFDALDDAGREKMAKRIMEGHDRTIWQNLLEEGKNDTGAQFQERLCRKALDLFWNSAEGGGSA